MNQELDAAGEFDGAALARLADWLNMHCCRGSGRPALKRLSGGQSNPTYELLWADRSFILRRKPLGRLAPKAHQIEREYRVLSALRESEVPVPLVRCLCEDLSIIGVCFYVMDFVQGRIFWDPRLPGFSRNTRAAIFDAMGETVAHLHSIDPAAVGLQSFGRPEGFMARQTALWSSQYVNAMTHDIPAMTALMEWLPRNIPSSGGQNALFHGDIRLDNFVFHPTEPRVVALLDWELATIGDPLADFAFHLMTWRMPTDLFRGLAGVDLNALGIPTESMYLEQYCRRRGRTHIPELHVYLAFSFFRLAAILQGVAKRALDGNASSAEAETVGRRAAPLATIACEIAKLQWK
jgi:aminoglycoside phosphotransferase (APT) family kinase protein